MEAMATAPEEPPRAACSGGGGRLNRIAVAVGDGCSKNKHAAAPVAVHDSSKVQRRWWLVEEEEEAAAVRCCDETMPWNVGGVRDGGSSTSEVCRTVAQSCAGRRRRAEQCGGSWSKKKKPRRWSVGTVAQSCAGASEVRRRCAGRWDLCVTVVLVVGELKVGRRRRTRRTTEKMKSQNNEGIGVF